MKPWLVAESTLDTWRDAPPEVVVLPFGATEPHGPHLPYATDNYQVEAVADRAAGVAWNRGARVAVLPVIPFGVQTTQRAYPLAMNLYPTTLFRVLSDLAETLAASGVAKGVILNGHGGNDFYGWIKETHGKTGVWFCQVNWFAIEAPLAKSLFPAGGDHANDFETSCVLSIRPDLVRLDRAGDGRTATARLSALREGWARAPREWDRYTADSTAGDPREATAEKGARYLEAVVTRLGEFLVELAAETIDASFPFEPLAQRGER
ncbi:MAG: creatininase family protein [Lacipirellulaceae bacterium]